MAVNIPIGADTSTAERDLKRFVEKTEKWLKSHSSTKSVPLATAANQAKELLHTIDKVQKAQEKLANTKFPTEQYTQRTSALKEQEKLYEQLAKQRDKLKSESGPTARFSAAEQEYQASEKAWEKMDKEFSKPGGVYEQAQAWLELREHVQETVASLEDAKERLAALQDPDREGVDTTELQRLKAEKDATQAEITRLLQKSQTETVTTEEFAAAYAADTKAAHAYIAEEKKVNAQRDATMEKIRQVKAEIASYEAELDAVDQYTAENFDSMMNLGDQLTEMENLEQHIEQLSADLDQMRSNGEDNQILNPEELEAVNEQIQEVDRSIEQLKSDIDQMEASGESHIMGVDTEQYAAGEQALSRMSAKLSIFYARLRSLNASTVLKPLMHGFTALEGIVNRLFALMTRLGARIVTAFRNATTHTQKANKSFRLTLSNILALTIGVSSLNAVFTKLRNVVKEGFDNLIGANVHDLKTKVDDLKASLLQLKNGFAAAFEPIVQAVIPYIQQLVAWITVLVDKFAQLIAALSGKSTYIKSLKKNIDAVGSAAKRALSPLDNLNVLTSPGGGGGNDFSGMFEEADVTSPIKKLAEKIKEIAKTLFEPIKKAWDKVGPYIISSWEHVKRSLSSLFMDIYDDFITVWQQPRTQKIFEHILTTFGNMLQFIGFIGDRFRDAWNLDDTGLKILEHIRNILEIITGWIQKISYSWAVWASELDFSPLLKAIEKFLEHMEPHVDSLFAMFSDFHTQVLQPLAKWTLEEGLPKLLDVLTNIADHVDWETLQKELSELWAHLEPFAERVGEGLLDFIEEVGKALAEFITSDTFANFLESLENWMDNTSAEDVTSFAESIGKIALAIVGLKAAFKGGKWISGVVKTLKAVPWATIGNGLKNVAGGIKNLVVSGADKLGALGSSIGNTITLAGGFKAFMTTDIATMVGEGTLSAGAAVGTSILAGIAAALGGGAIGKLLDNYVIGPILEFFGSDSASWYKNFKWFGEGGFFQELFSFNSLQEALDVYVGATKLAFEDIVNFFVKIGSTIASWWENDVIAPIKAGWETVKEWFAGTALGQFIAIFQDPHWKEDVVNAFHLMGDDIKAWWDEHIVTPFRETKLGQLVEIFTSPTWKEDVVGAFELMGEDIKTWWDNLTDPANWTFEGIKTAFEDAIYAIKMMWDDLVNWLNDKLSIDIAGKTVSLGKLPTSSPSGGGGGHRFATGGVIPPYTSEHLVTVGDNDHETEVISPLSTMQEAMINALKSVGFTGNGGNQEIVINMDGREIMKAVVKQNAEYKKQHNGMSAFG